MLCKYLLILFLCFGPSVLQSQEIKLMTYNIKYDNVNDTVNNWNDRREKLIELIEHYGPSFIGTQEALYRQVIYIDSSLTDFKYIGSGREDGEREGEYSPIHYDSTKYKELRHDTFWLSETPDKASVGWDAALERICTYGLFEDNKTRSRFWVFNTHFDHKGEVAREKSAELILRKIKEINTENLPVVLMGDLNLTPDQKPIHRIKKHMEDGQKITETPFYGPMGTFNGFDQNLVLDRRIDYIFVKDLVVESYIHIDDRMQNNRHISDHLPVLISVSK